MNTYISKLLTLLFAVILSSSTIIAQKASNSLLLRDSLDFKQNQVGVNSDNNEFNPIPYKGGLLFVSNKKSATNPLGFNKVYWVPQSLLGKKSNGSDSLKKKFNFNDDFTAPTSNDNNILTRYSRAKAKKSMNAVEQQFADFNPDQAFAIDDTNNIVIYPKLSNKKVNGLNRWELWEATLQNGRTIKDHKIKIIDSAADYLYPNLTDNGNKLYFSSNRTGGKGGNDIYVIEKVNGVWQNQPLNLAEINTEANEIYPIAMAGSLRYTSDRVGGVGGYDLYEYLPSKKLNRNLGYPINTANDDLALSVIGDQYYLTSNRAGSIDIVAMNYAPINISINGQLIYARDGQLVPNQKLYIFDVDENILVDSVMTDANANYSFNAKPNRNYQASAYNADGIKEVIAFKTNDQIIQKADIALNLQGRSPKIIKDSIYTAMVIAEKAKEDSINNVMGYNSKYIVYYGFDKAVLSTKEKKTLDALAAKLKTNNNAYIIVGAFTDCVGSFKYNYALSVKRAQYAVKYLRAKGVPKKRFTSNGYSKNYTITPCDPRSKNARQQVNRRAEIVLSEVKSTNWATLEKDRGKDYYATVFSTRNKNLPTIKPSIKLDQTLQVKSVPVIALPVKVDSVKVVKESIVKVTKPAPVKVLPVKVDSVKVVKVTPAKPTPVKQVVDSVKTETVRMPSRRPNTEKGPMLDKKATEEVKEVKEIKEVKVETKPVAQTQKEEKVIVANVSEYNDEMAKEEILKALDSLATLKKEQERIIEYMTKRINKKPIDVFVSSDSVTIEIYDNGIHDKDSVSIIYNNRIVVDKQELKVRKPITFKLKVDKNKKYNELVLVAENLGSEPPNTAVMFVTEKSGRRQQVMLATDMTHNEVVYFIRIGKE
jgi:outer membrane protein OmpA-like peptidoglycan-associated protein/PHD/YefM family antitoxin component YafN of YafNO toxin-antitoxin module